MRILRKFFALAVAVWCRVAFYLGRVDHRVRQAASAVRDWGRIRVLVPEYLHEYSSMALDGYLTVGGLLLTFAQCLKVSRIEEALRALGWKGIVHIAPERATADAGWHLNRGFIPVNHTVYQCWSLGERVKVGLGVRLIKRVFYMRLDVFICTITVLDGRTWQPVGATLEQIRGGTIPVSD